MPLAFAQLSPPLAALLALTPLLLILFLLLVKRMGADLAGAFGLALAVLLAFVCFGTAPSVVGGALLSGVVGSLPVGLVLTASIFQITVMAEMGALARVTALMKTLTPDHPAVQVLLINVGFGILLTGLGAATMAILPPLLLTLGYSVPAAILLGAFGYVGLCMYALLGIPAVMLSTFAGQGLQETGMALASFMPAMSICVAFACLHVKGGFALMRKGFWPALITGLSSGLMAMLLARLGLVTVTAILAGFTIMAALLIYVKCSGGPLRDPSLRNKADLAAEAHLPLWRACSPWIMLTVVSLIMNSPWLPFFDLVFRQWSMPLEIIPGAPERLRLFWQAYFWVLVSTLLCLPLLKPSTTRLASALQKSLRRAWRPFVATAIYFCIAYVMNHSGKQVDWKMAADGQNMVLALAHGSTQLFGAAYPAAAPWLGLLAGFISGSSSSAVAMFTKLQMAAADSLGASPLTLAAAGSIGGGLAGGISPSKLLSSAASIDQPEAANGIIGYAFMLTLGIMVVCSVLTQWWAY